MRYLAILILGLTISKTSLSQGCCSGGSGSPIAGGTSQGVLAEGQMELGTNYQYFGSDKFLAGDNDSSSGNVRNLFTQYLYTRVAYGITSKLTLSIEAGYFFNKTETGFDYERPDYKKTSSGISDLIIFPRYDVYDKTDEFHHTEVTLGLGLKIPIGNYHDSTTVYVDPTNGQKLNIVSPPTVQPTTGSNDFIFYGFVFREYKKAKFRVFANALYMRKGFNRIGEKFGDYGSIGLFAGKTFFKKLGLTAQLKYEWIDKAVGDPNVDYAALNLSFDPNSTGSKKLSFVPQISYSYKSFTVFTLYDLPLYQYMYGLQISSKYLVTAGLSYRFMPMKNLWKKAE